MLDLYYPYFIVAPIGMIAFGILLFITILLPIIITKFDKEVPDDYFDIIDETVINES